MAAWLDKGGDEGRRAGIEGDTVKRRERKEEEMKGGEGLRIARLTRMIWLQNNSLNTCICIRSSVSSLFRHEAF